MKITDKLIKASCSPTMYKRGGEYFCEGRVHLKKRGQTQFSAAVDDGSIFTVEAEYDEEKLIRSFCTCTYYQTMRSPCKHIVAALMERQKELDEGGGATDVNDKIAKSLCSSFASYDMPKIRLNLKFELYIKRAQKGVTYSMAITADGMDGQLDGIDNFLESYASGKSFKMSKDMEYIPGVTEFRENQAAILDILAGAYMDRSTDMAMYTKAIYRTTFSSYAASRIFPYLRETEFTVTIDGVKCPNVVFADDDPDILIDIDATDADISLSLGARGLALNESGEWFMYENTIYHTSEEWREYFMPVYKAAVEENRLQITFRGANRLLFAKHLLPRLKEKRGVIMQGLDELIIDSAPRFEIYLDSDAAVITAVVIAYYGSVALRLKVQDVSEEKVIVRDKSAEDRILSEFDKFDYSDGTFTLRDDAGIFEFVSNSLPNLRESASVYLSSRFENLFITEDINILTTVNYNSGVDFLETGFESNLSKEELWEILKSIRSKKKFYRLQDGRFLDFENGKNIETIKLLNYLDFSREEINDGRKQLSKYYALYLDNAAGVKKLGGFKALISDMRSIGANVPEGLDDVLRDYQKAGIVWMKQLAFLGFGGILADDMGLGKTLQVLAYIHGEKIGTPTMIVTPSALMYNWKNEITRFIPDASALIIDGPREERERLITGLNDYEFIITSYPLLRRDTMLYKDISFKYMFIDEAQHIKNAKTMNAKAVKRISAQYKFAVTGTPIENSLSELWSVFDFIMPGYLYSLSEFRERYEYPIMRAGDAAGAAELRAKIKPFILRRMKNEVLKELPDRIEETIYADLSQHQKNMYMAYLETARSETAAALAEGGSGRMRVLTLLMRLRQICCHPSLFDAGYTRDSGKLNLLLELVDNAVSGGHRILIFSQFTSMLSIISEELTKRGMNYFYLDGKTPPEERAWMSERFNDGVNDVFLISLKAGGTGLNLVGADMVIHYDPWWNPAVMDQASDRAYRIGQTKAVHIIKLASRGTIEEKILRLQEIKRSLAEDIITANSAVLSALTDEEIMSLFG